MGFERPRNGSLDILPAREMFPNHAETLALLATQAKECRVIDADYVTGRIDTNKHRSVRLSLKPSNSRSSEKSVRYTARGSP